MRLRALAVALVAAFLLSSASIAAGPPIKIGGLFDLSGKAQHIGVPTKQVAMMVVDQINRSGGVGGRMIQLISVDTESEPSKAVVAFNRLVSKDKVVAVIGPTTTGAAMASMGAIEKAGIPVVATVGGDIPLRKWLFKSPQRTTTAVQRLFTYLKAKRLNTVVVLGASDKFGQEGVAALNAEAPKFGIKILSTESFNPIDPDMTVQVAKAASAKPKAIVVWTIGPAGAIIAKNAKQAGVRIPLFQCHGQPDANYIKIAGAAANGTMMPSTKLVVADQLPNSDRQKPVELAFIKEFKARKIGEVGTHSGYAWDAIQIIARAMKKAGTDPARLQKAIEGTKGYVGVSGIYNMSPTDHCGLGIDSLVMVKVVNGRYKLAK